jgi:hypothetical protein
MLNSEFLEEQAAHFASRLRREADDAPSAQIQRGLRLALQREPSKEEVALCLNTLSKFQNELQLPKESALQRVALMILNLNEFLYLD